MKDKTVNIGQIRVADWCLSALEKEAFDKYLTRTTLARKIIEDYFRDKKTIVVDYYDNNDTNEIISQYP